MAFITAFQKWLEVVDYGSEEKNRVARYLQGLALIIIGATLVLAINYAIMGEAIIIGLLIGTALFFAVLLGLVRRGQLELVRFLFVLSGLFILTVGLLLKNGVRGAGAFLYPVLLIFASLLLARRAFIMYIVLTLMSIALIIVAESQQALYIQKFDPPNLTLFITYGLMILLTATTIRFITENWQNSLKRSEADRRVLKEQQALLATSEQRWRLLVTHAPALIVSVDRAGVIKFVNAENAEKLIRAEKTFFDFLVPAYVAEALQAVNTCFATGQPSQYEWETINVKPHPAWFNVELGPVLENGQVASVTLIATEITNQKQAEAALRQLNAELDQRVRERTAEAEAAYRELEMFSYAISHNLRSPVRGMTGFAEMILRDHDEQLDASARDLLRRISTGAITMGSMIDDLLGFLQLGRVPLKLRAASPTQLAQTALAGLPAYRDARHIAVTIDPMPPVIADADLLLRVFANLIDNAIKFTRARQDATIHVGATQTDQGVTFFVRDNGIGFDMRYVDKLFGVFQQLHRPGEYEGTGVGLATVQRIVRRHGGQIWAEAELHRGATFYFTL